MAGLLYECPYRCGFEATTQSAYIKHRMRHHWEPRPFYTERLATEERPDRRDTATVLVRAYSGLSR